MKVVIEIPDNVDEMFLNMRIGESMKSHYFNRATILCCELKNNEKQELPEPTIDDAMHCLRMQLDEDNCEDCRLSQYKDDTLCKKVANINMKALKEYSKGSDSKC